MSKMTVVIKEDRSWVINVDAPDPTEAIAAAYGKITRHTAPDPLVSVRATVVRETGDTDGDPILKEIGLA